MKLIRILLCVVIFTSALILLDTNHALAVTANPNPVSFVQPDGSTLTIILKGDEFIHWAETPDGYTLLSNKSGAYEYAMLSPDGKMGFSGIQASEENKRGQQERSFLSGIPKGIFFTKMQIAEMKESLKKGHAPRAPLAGVFPTTGTRKLLVILANFSNTSTTYTQTNFDNYMNQVNYNGTGSFKDYYLEVSYGQLIINSTVTVWVTLPNTHNYYGPDTKWGEFALAAVTAANTQAAVNFADYDNNSDGIVDGVAIFHQGQGQEETANTNDIWSHSWSLSDAGFTSAQCTFDGVLVDAYTTMPEKNSTGMGTIGVMCHEFGHNLGAPDFYDTNYSTGGQYTGTGDWDLMAGGSWNGNSGDKPAHHNAYTKAYVYGWTTPTVLSTVQTKTLRKAETFTDVVRYNTPTANEYFLCENRQKTGFDTGIPGHGLIIFHVDGNYIASHSGANDINAGSHQGLYPVCASATGNPTTTYGTIDGTGCPYPGTSNKTTFSDATTPHSHSWAGANTGYPLVSITENTTTQEITFCFISCTTPNDPTNLTATPSSTTQINLSWGLNTNSNPVVVAFSTTPTFGTPVTGTTYVAGNTIAGGGTVLYSGTNLTFNHTGLSPNTTYYYKAWSLLSGTAYSTGIIANATTLCSVTALPFTESFTNTTIPNCWTLLDNQGSGQVWQFGTITTQTPNPALTGNYAYLNSDAYGSTSAQNADLITPTINMSAYSAVTLQFKHYFKYYSGSSAKLSYSINNGSTWTVIATYTATSATNPVNFSQVIAAVAGQSQVKFKWNYTGTYGYSWAIDDISITGTSSVSLAVTPSNQNVTAAAGTTPFTVTTTAAWTATSDAAWCTVTPSGSGNGTLTATYTLNSGASRVANITVAAPGATSVVVTVTQTGATPTLSVTPSNQNVTSPAGNTNFTVTSNSAWTVSSNAAWCTVTPSGTGNGTIAATYTQNTLLTSRVANVTVTVVGLTPIVVTVTQAAGSATLSVTPANQNVSAVAGNTNFAVMSNSPWTTSSNAAWCTVTPSGTGDGTIVATYTANGLVTSRVATITVTVTGLTPVTVTVTQSGSAPTLSVTPSNQNVTSPAGNTSFTLTSNSAWTATSNATWCTPTPSGTGNGSIVATYLENTTLTSRVANITVTVAGLTPIVVTVTQAAATSSLIVNPINIDVPATAGVANYTVTTNAPGWTATSNTFWCVVTPSGTSSGTMAATYEANTSINQRISYLAISVPGAPNANVTLTQAAAAPFLSIDPHVQNVNYPAGTVTFNVNANIPWTATSNASWCTVTNSGNGNGTITATFNENTFAANRTASINVNAAGGIPLSTVVTIEQQGPTATISINPPTRTVTDPAGSTTFAVTTNISWTCSSNASWCVPTPSGSGNGTITATYQQNLTQVIRTANIQVSGPGITTSTIQVIQLPSFVSVGQNPESNLQVYPNPSTGQFIISSASNDMLYMRVTIIDSEGRTILTKQCSGEKSYSIDLSQSAKGNYYMRVDTGRKVSVIKVIVE